MQFGEWDCYEIPTEAPKDEKVVRFVGQAASAVVRQTCSQLEMSQRFDTIFDGECLCLFLNLDCFQQ